MSVYALITKYHRPCAEMANASLDSLPYVCLSFSGFFKCSVILHVLANRSSLSRDGVQLCGR